MSKGQIVLTGEKRIRTRNQPDFLTECRWRLYKYREKPHLRRTTNRKATPSLNKCLFVYRWRSIISHKKNLNKSEIVHLFTEDTVNLSNDLLKLLVKNAGSGKVHL